jgi:hypothetical protein
VTHDSSNVQKLQGASGATIRMQNPNEKNMSSSNALTWVSPAF